MQYTKGFYGWIHGTEDIDLGGNRVEDKQVEDWNPITDGVFSSGKRCTKTRMVPIGYVPHLVFCTAINAFLINQANRERDTVLNPALTIEQMRIKTEEDEGEASPPTSPSPKRFKAEPQSPPVSQPSVFAFGG